MTCCEPAQGLALLERVRAALLQPTDLPELLRTILEATAQTLDYPLVMLYRRVGDDLVLQQQVGSACLAAQIPQRQGVFGQIVQTGRPILLGAIPPDPLYPAGPPPGMAHLGVPLFDQGQIVGVLGAVSRRVASLLAADMPLVQAVADYMGLALTQARLYGAVQAREAQLHQVHAELHALHESTLGLIEQRDPHTLLTLILARAAGLVGTAHAYLYIREAGTPDLVVRYGLGLFAPIIGYHLPLGTGVAGRVAQSGQVLSVADYPHWDGHDTELANLGMRAVCGIPLWMGPQIAGVLGVAYVDAERSFDADTLALLERFGELASLALENARLYTAAQQELSERTRVETRLAHMATHDPLTDLPNRTLLQDRIEQALRAARRGDPHVALLIMDLDRFKEVNDTQGHYLGDRLLQVIAARLRETLRAADTIARLGGDEFAAVLPATDGATAEEIASRLVAALQQPVVVEDQMLHVGVSIGIALCPEHGYDPETLLRLGDVAMYAAKRQGGGYCMYQPSQNPYHAPPQHLAPAS